MKKNLSLILGILIPVLMIVFVAVSIYLPGIFIKPQYDFIYTSGGDYLTRDSYVVETGRVVKKEVQYPEKNFGVKGEAKLYFHNVAKNFSREISLEEAERYYLSSAKLSPDGFSVDKGESDYSIFSMFFSRGGGYYGDRYIHGRGISRRLNLHTEEQYYYRGMRFLGWVLEERP